MLKMNEQSYYANLGLLKCKHCGNEAIISIERAEKIGLYIEDSPVAGEKHPYCPYCGSTSTIITSRTTDETRGEFHLGTFTLCEPVE